MTTEAKWQRFMELAGELSDLSRAAAVLGWDQQTYMPPGGGEARAQQRATLQRVIHERLTGAEVGELLADLEAQGAAGDDPFRKAVLRETRRMYDQAVKIPADLAAEFVRVTSVAMNAWARAREEGDFDLFRPHLERIVELTCERADALGYTTDRYDALLDLYEPGATRDEVNRIFEGLRGTLIPLLHELLPKLGEVDDGPFRRELARESQMAFVNEVIAQIGFDYNRGRMDLSAHPFTISFSPNDVRLTTRIDPNDLRMALYSAIHEAGHGMYEQGIPARWERTPVGAVPSLGLHESQSRMWENVIGRSREFWAFFLPKLRQAFPGEFDGVDVDAVYRAVNRVEPSYIRTEADEVTYNLHIMIRYELEQALVDGSLAVADLPGAWDAKMEEYLTVRPRSVREGVLQDVHWSMGSIGYFPTYSLGTILAVQLFEAACKEHPEIPSEIAAGNFEPVRHWMQRNVYDQACLYTPKELLEKVTGTGYDPEPYLAYIKGKYGELYGL